MVDCTLLGAVQDIGTYAEDEHLLIRYVRSDCVDAWNRVLDKLIGWWQSHCYREVDDGIEWPNRAVLSLAGQLLVRLRDAQKPAPTNTVPSGDGGVVFEWRAGPYYQKLEINKDGKVESFRFNRGKLDFRQQLPLA
jgi:hypothetical protein